MTKIVINRQYGGFSLSHEAVMRYAELKGIELRATPCESLPGVYYDYTLPDGNYWIWYDLARDDPVLVQTVEELGKKADGQYSNLVVVSIPDDVQWHIGEYDGLEWVAENHRTWRGAEFE